MVAVRILLFLLASALLASAASFLWLAATARSAHA
jgi:hypothetical protein